MCLKILQVIHHCCPSLSSSFTTSSLSSPSPSSSLLPDKEEGYVRQQLASNFPVQVSSAPTPSYNDISSNTLVAKKTVFHVKPTLRPVLSCYGGNGGARPLR